DLPVQQGRIDADKCGELCSRLIDLEGSDEIYLCGPGEMIFSIKNWLEKQGVPEKKVHFELFHPLDSSVAAKTPSIRQEDHTGGKTEKEISRVTVRLDGVNHVFELPYEGPSILDAALYEGADLPFACKGGVCCTCRAKLKEGKVDMDLNYALEADELAAGFILTCQSHPRTPTVLVDFDSK